MIMIEEMLDYHRLLVLEDVMGVLLDVNNIEAARRELGLLIVEFRSSPAKYR
jgi:hypothetical protein